MAGKKNPSVAEWEKQLINDYYEYRWRQALDPICEKMERWRAGEISHSEMADFLEEVHREVCELRNLFTQREDRLVLLIQWLDREWFDRWVKEHVPPKGARVIPMEE